MEARLSGRWLSSSFWSKRNRMPIPVVNRLAFGLSGPRVRLGAPLPAEAMAVLAVTPDAVPPDKVPPSPVTTGEADKARNNYQLAAGALEGEVAWLKGLRPANFDERVIEVIKHSRLQYDTLVRDVRGRTGNPGAEYALELEWWNLWNRAYQAYSNPPSWLEQAVDKISVFMSDFIQGAQQAWQSYSDWAIRHSGPVLSKYHDSLRHVAELEVDLAEARASGSYSAGQIFDQELAVERAKDALDMVRSTYKTLSAGGDIDKIAIEVHGPYMGAIQLTAALAIKVVIVAAVIAVAAITVFGVGKIVGGISQAFTDATEAVSRMVKKDPVGTIFLFGLVAAMIGLPFAIFKKPPVTIQTLPPPAPSPKPEAAS